MTSSCLCWAPANEASKTRTVITPAAFLPTRHGCARRGCTRRGCTRRGCTVKTTMSCLYTKTGKRNRASDLHHFFKQVRAQPDAGAQKLFVELRADTRCRESSHHLAIRI